jgi:hypothetical protein
MTIDTTLLTTARDKRKLVFCTNRVFQVLNVLKRRNPQKSASCATRRPNIRSRFPVVLFPVLCEQHKAQLNSKSLAVLFSVSDKMICVRTDVHT